MSLYRVYFRNQHAFIIGHDDFVAVDDEDAMVVAKTLADACSDLCAGYELWQSARRVDTSPEQTIPNANGIAARVQDIVLERELVLQHTRWVVGESRRLLEATQRLLDSPRGIVLEPQLLLRNSRGEPESARPLEQTPCQIFETRFADDRPMQELSLIAEKHPTVPPATLGDVLYAKSKAPVPEQEWAALVQSIAAGDQLALHALYERAHRIVFTLIMRITTNRETAEELTIDVFHDVWRRASRYNAANGTVLGWIMNQARSRAIDRLRFEGRKKRTQDENVQPPAETAADPRDVLELREHRESLRAALAALTADERQAIETTFFAGLTHAEAAARLNQPLGTIKTRIRSGLHKLRHILTAQASER